MARVEADAKLAHAGTPEGASSAPEVLQDLIEIQSEMFRALEGFLASWARVSPSSISHPQGVQSTRKAISVRPADSLTAICWPTGV